MMYNKMKIGCELPYANWFIDNIFSKQDGNISDYLTKQELNDLMQQMELVKSENIKRKKSLSSGSSESRITKFINMVFFKHPDSVEPIRVLDNSRTKRDVLFESESPNEYDKCYSANELTSIFSISNLISKIDFYNLSPALIYMKARGTCEASGPTESESAPSKVSNAESELCCSILLIIWLIFFICFI